MDVDLVTIITNQGFAIAVSVFLLYERQKFNEKIVRQLTKIALIIDERVPKEAS